MDGPTFDRLAQSVAFAGSRRRFLGALTGLGLGGVLAAAGLDDAGAERPRDRLSRRTRQHRRKRRNEKRRNRNNGGNGGGGGGLGSTQCGATGDDCTQDSDCCTNTCFHFECAEKVRQCSDGGTTNPCRPPAKGCAGDRCCRGALSCNDGCCSEDANQCNINGDCCVPNCAGKQCGPDGCGAGGTCGACPSGTVCNESTGQCPQPGCDVCPTCRYTTVQAAVADVNGPATIHICAGIYPEAVGINRSLTLIGTGQGGGSGDTILGFPGGTGGVLINSGVASVTLQDLRITGSDGSGIHHIGELLTMTDCTVTGFQSTLASGAGIFADAKLVMTRCTISDNSVTSNQALGGGLSIDNAEVTLTDCTITGNSANGTDTGRIKGGGIYVDFSGTLKLDRTLVTENSTNGEGGGIFSEEDEAVTLTNGSSVTRNDPDNCAGGLIIGCTN